MIRKYMAIALTLTLMLDVMFAGPAIAKMECRFDKDAYAGMKKDKFIEFCNLVIENKRDKAVAMVLNPENAIVAVCIVTSMMNLHLEILGREGNLVMVKAINPLWPPEQRIPVIWWTTIDGVECR